MKRIMCIVMAATIIIGSSGEVFASNVKQNNSKKVTTSDSIKNQKQSVKVTQKKIKYENVYLKCDIQIPVVQGLKNKNIEKKINNLLETDSLNIKNTIEKNAKKDFADMKKQGIKFQKHEIRTQYKVTYNKNNVLSITMTNYQYAGGAHGTTFKESYNIDLKTGNRAMISDIFDKSEDYKGIIIDSITKNIEKDKDKYFDNASKVVSKMCQEQDFYIEGNNIVVYYQLYDIAPYSTGIPEFKIPFSAFKKGVNLNLNIKDPSVTVKSDVIYDSTESLELDLRYPVISGLKNKKIQENINKMFKGNVEKSKTDIEKEVKEYIDEAKKNNWEIRPYALDSDYFISYNHKNLLSITDTVYKYTGGAHGSTDIRAYNIDLSTGKQIDLKGMFKNDYDYKSVINKEIKRQMKTSNDEFFKEKSSNFEGITENQSFYIEDKNIVVYFGQYEIAPYAAGIPTYRIPLNLLKKGIKADIIRNFGL